MVIAWGLELSKPMDEVHFVAKFFFVEDMLGGLDFILDWSVPGMGADLAECFEQEDENWQFGYVPFLRWCAKDDKPSLFKVAMEAWEKMMEEIFKHKGGSSQAGSEWVIFPCGKRNPQGHRPSFEFGIWFCMCVGGILRKAPIYVVAIFVIMYTG